MFLLPIFFIGLRLPGQRLGRWIGNGLIHAGLSSTS